MLRRWVRTASGFSPPTTSFFALRSFLTSFMGLRVRPRLKRRRMRARKRSTSASVFMSRSCSRSVPRKENLRKVRFLGASATRASSSDCGGGKEKRGRGGERRAGGGGRLEKHPRGEAQALKKLRRRSRARGPAGRHRRRRGARHARATTSSMSTSARTERRGTFARASRRGRRWPARISRTHGVRGFPSPRHAAGPET